jgi:uncharacterized Zn finger protein (UPF0148 family)
MSTVQRKAFLKKDGFTQHKNNARGNTIIYSRKHSTEKFVRIVVDSGIDKNTNKICGQAKAKLVYINRENHWRVITKEVSSNTISSLVQSQSNSISSVPQCKHCKAKKFTAKSGNVVCANACWTTWGNKKKTQKKSSQKTTQKTTQKSSQKKSARTYKKKSQQYYYLDLKVGDLVTVETIDISSQKILHDYKILGVITKIDDDNNVTTLWTTNETHLYSTIPKSNRIPLFVVGEIDSSWARFKVMSRKVEWVIK